MDWIQVVTIIGTISGIMFYLINRLVRDISRIEGNIEKANSRLDSHAQRIDQVYRTILEMLKNKS